MAILKDQAQVLRVYEQGNTSQVLVLLGRRYGQMRVLAKGARRVHKKGFEGGFDLLARGQILAYPRADESLWIFKEWEERARWRMAGRSPEVLYAASYLCELAEALSRETAGAEETGESWAVLYDRLAAAADELARLPDEATAGPILLRFTLEALAFAGLAPELGACSRCGGALSGPRGTGRAALLGYAGLECVDCLAGEALERLPVDVPPPATKDELAQTALRMRAGEANAAPAGVWLPPEALAALGYVKRTGRPVKLTVRAARACARALVVLVHAALERDLRTLRAAARSVLRMSGEVSRRKANQPSR